VEEGGIRNFRRNKGIKEREEGLIRGEDIIIDEINKIGDIGGGNRIRGEEDKEEGVIEEGDNHLEIEVIEFEEVEIIIKEGEDGNNIIIDFIEGIIEDGGELVDREGDRGRGGEDATE
jgi:hypothetical protein